MGKILGYARVSTLNQNLDLQMDALEHAGAQVIYTENILRLEGKVIDG